MLRLTKKGQASSTFQLLIAAIVALAILGVLISVIGGINTVSGDAKTAVTQKLKTQMNNPGAIDCTDQVTFKKGTSLAAEGVTKETGLSSNQVFFSNEVDNMQSSFEVIGLDKSVLKYLGTSSKKVVLCVLCSDNGGTGLEESISTYSLEISSPSPAIEDGQSACVIYPKKTA